MIRKPAPARLIEVFEADPPDQWQAPGAPAAPPENNTQPKTQESNAYLPLSR